MASQRKRKRSFGLATRLTIIALFIGVGTWAVFNSKFRKTEVAHAGDHDHESDGEPDGESNHKDDKSVPAGPKAESGENSKPSGISKTSLTNKTPDTSSKTDIQKRTIPMNPVLDSGNKSATFLKPEKEEPKPFKKPPASKGFNPTDTVSGSNKPPSNTFSLNDATSKSKSGFSPPSTGFSPAKSDSTKSGPPSATFDPKGAFDPTGSFKSNKSDAAKNTAPKKPQNSFSLAGKTTPGKSDGADRSKPGSTPPAAIGPSSKNGTALQTPAGKPSSAFDPTGTFGQTAKNSTSPSKPPASAAFNPGAPATKSVPSKGGSFGNASFGQADKTGLPDSKPPASSGLAGNTGSNFQSVPSSGAEKPLRGGDSGGSFSLSSNGSASNNSSAKSPNNGFSLSSKSGDSPPPSSSTNSLTPSAASSAKFGGAAFTDKGSRKLEPRRENPSGLANSPNSASNRSGSGFGNVTGTPSGQTAPPSSRPDNNLDLSPKGNNSFSNSSAPLVETPRSNAAPAGNNTRPPTARILDNQSLQPNSAKPPATSLASSGRDVKPLMGAGDQNPGPNSLEGIQTPAITLQKIAPREVQVDVPATFKIIVRNVGRSPATNVVIIDPVPEGTEFQSATPQPTERATDGSLVWRIGAMAPGQTREVSVNLVPRKQGEIGSVARMTFQAAASAKSISTKPKIGLTHTGPQKVLKGTNAQFVVTIRNNGDGIARNVSIEEDVPEGFVFSNGSGNRLAYEIGALAPGQARNVTLHLRAIKSGKYVSRIKARIGKALASTHDHSVEVVAPVLKMKLTGPARRFIEREAVYNVEVENIGSAAAKNIMMVTRLPQGMRFVSTNNRGQYNPRQHAVYWSMIALAPQNKGSVELKLMPTGTGAQQIQYEARSATANTTVQSYPVVIDQLAELFFEVEDRDDPIEVNGETEYTVRVINQGTKSATQVVLNVDMPPGINATDTMGPTKGIVSGKRIAFAPLARLAPKGEAIYRIKAKGLSDGDHLIKVTLASSERPEAVAKQESTKVYSEFR